MATILPRPQGLKSKYLILIITGVVHAFEAWEYQAKS